MDIMNQGTELPGWQRPDLLWETYQDVCKRKGKPKFRRPDLERICFDTNHTAKVGLRNETKAVFQVLGCDAGAVTQPHDWSHNLLMAPVWQNCFVGFPSSTQPTWFKYGILQGKILSAWQPQ